MASWRPGSLSRVERAWLALMAFAGIICVLAPNWPARLVGLVAVLYAAWRIVADRIAEQETRALEWHATSEQVAQGARQWREKHEQLEHAHDALMAQHVETAQSAAVWQQRFAAAEREIADRGHRIVRLEAEARRSPSAGGGVPRDGAGPARVGGADLRDQDLGGALIELDQLGQLRFGYVRPLSPQAWAALHRLAKTRFDEMDAAFKELQTLVWRGQEGTLSHDDRVRLGTLVRIFDGQPESTDIVELLAPATRYALADVPGAAPAGRSVGGVRGEEHRRPAGEPVAAAGFEEG